MNHQTGGSVPSTLKTTLYACGSKPTAPNQGRFTSQVVYSVSCSLVNQSVRVWTLTFFSPGRPCQGQRTSTFQSLASIGKPHRVRGDVARGGGVSAVWFFGRLPLPGPPDLVRVISKPTPDWIGGSVSVSVKKEGRCKRTGGISISNPQFNMKEERD